MLLFQKENIFLVFTQRGKFSKMNSLHLTTCQLLMIMKNIRNQFVFVAVSRAGDAISGIKIKFTLIWMGHFLKK